MWALSTICTVGVENVTLRQVIYHSFLLIEKSLILLWKKSMQKVDLGFVSDLK